MKQATVHRMTDKRTGKSYWIEHRIGFRGHEWNYGGGWRDTRTAAREAAEKSGSMREVTADR